MAVTIKRLCAGIAGAAVVVCAFCRIPTGCKLWASGTSDVDLTFEGNTGRITYCEIYAPDADIKIQLLDIDSEGTTEKTYPYQSTGDSYFNVFAGIPRAFDCRGGNIGKISIDRTTATSVEVTWY